MYISKTMPDRNEALIYKHLEHALLMLWDPVSNTQTGEKIYIQNAVEWGGKTL